MRIPTLSAPPRVALLAGAASAQDYPTGPITIVVPFAAGGPTDTVTRLVAEPMGEALGQQIVVQNVGGAGGTLGATQVAQRARRRPHAAPAPHRHVDGALALRRTSPSTRSTSFAPIGLVTNVPMTIIARKDFEPTRSPSSSTT